MVQNFPICVQLLVLSTFLFCPPSPSVYFPVRSTYTSGLPSCSVHHPVRSADLGFSAPFSASVWLLLSCRYGPRTAGVPCAFYCLLPGALAYKYACSCGYRSRFSISFITLSSSLRRQSVYLFHHIRLSICPSTFLRHPSINFTSTTGPPLRGDSRIESHFTPQKSPSFLLHHPPQPVLFFLKSVSSNPPSIRTTPPSPTFHFHPHCRHWVQKPTTLAFLLQATPSPLLPFFVPNTGRVPSPDPAARTVHPPSTFVRFSVGLCQFLTAGAGLLRGLIAGLFLTMTSIRPPPGGIPSWAPLMPDQGVIYSLSSTCVWRRAASSVFMPSCSCQEIRSPTLPSCRHDTTQASSTTILKRCFRPPCYSRLHPT